MAGMRVGVVHSENRDLVQALDQLGAFHGVPGLTQYQMAQLFRDRGTHIFFPCFVNIFPIHSSHIFFSVYYARLVLVCPKSHYIKRIVLFLVVFSPCFCGLNPLC